jgi:hypothetical protein
MVTWIPSIYPLFVSIYTSTINPMGNEISINKPIFSTGDCNSRKYAAR